MVYTESISVKTERRLQVIDITHRVLDVLSRSGVSDGVLNVWTPHTTACVTVNEADPDLWEDMLEAFTRLVPVEGRYRHNEKYRWMPREQNAHAHILTSMVKPCVSIPVQNGRPLLGTWQRILFVELDGPRSRSVQVSILGG